MATKFGNVKGVKFLEEPRGANRGGLALLTFDIVAGIQYVGGTDTLQLGSLSASQAYENEVLSTTALSVVTMLQNRRRDGRTVVIDQAMMGPFPGYDTAAGVVNGPFIYAQSVSVTAVVGCLQLNLFSAGTGGSAVTTNTAGVAWQSAGSLAIMYTASYPGANPE